MELMIAIAGGFAGGVLGVIGTIFSSYYGPRKMEEWREKRKAEKWDNPRKELLLKILSDPERQLRSIETLCRISGTNGEECRRLLIEIEARGIRLKDNREGWVLIKNKPLSEITEDEIGND
ncbi:MAG: hypothetical protein PHV82_17125 [Victivallaceae bacterium]|nr:hypothetical protein [Victivallaceae bacterium]